MLIRIISLYGLSEYLKDRAREVVEVLQAAQFAAHTPVTTQTLGPTISTQGNAQVIASQTMAQFTCGPSSSIPANSVYGSIYSSSTAIPLAVSSHGVSASAATTVPAALTTGEFVLGGPSMQPSSQAVLPPLSSRAATNTVNTGGHAIPHGHYPPPGWSVGANNFFSNTNLSLAINHMNSIGESINEDLTTAEQEVNSEAAYLTAASIPGLNEFCSSIEDKIQSGYREAAAYQMC